MQLDNSCNLLYELGMKYGTDKVHHHEYHKIYDFYLKNFYNSRGSILEIGIDNGTSVKLWLDLFPHAHIYGMDIKVTTFGDRYSIIKGDQSNCSHLSELVNVIKDTGLFFINDDGSHIPEHQLLSFNFTQNECWRNYFIRQCPLERKSGGAIAKKRFVYKSAFRIQFIT